MERESQPTEATEEAERADASQSPAADRAPTSAEEAAADASRKKFEGDEAEVAKHYEEMADLGVNEKGEGRIE
jgi:hypothetical protein